MANVLNHYFPVSGKESIPIFVSVLSSERGMILPQPCQSILFVRERVLP